MTEWTTLSVKKETAERVNERKAEMNEDQSDLPDISTDDFINTLLDTEGMVQEHGYGDGASDSGKTWSDEEVERFKEAFDGAVIDAVETDRGVSYDDVVQACRKAIRDELPTERMG